ncbi:MAG: moderate conductance mechanosensitive channel [Frankiales bacterium]|nr:moderate conductance mechanosensitive channel [Frankiales bacterium]MDX6273867.1 moderate conductance mechanosensitive channel [Frankiales bacterium]
MSLALLTAAASDASCVDKSGEVARLIRDWTHHDRTACVVDVLVTKPLRIVLVVVLALLLRRLLKRAIQRAITRATAVGMSERRRLRADTLGGILESIASATVLSVAFVMVLGELGLNLAPIIASAGIAGVALGFGAQNLVKDFLSGVFNILEDQFGVGDEVDTGFATGVVEAVGLRTTRLRDVTGVVWHVRNGEILRIGNRSQGGPGA